MDAKIESYIRAMSGDVGKDEEQDCPVEVLEQYYTEEGGKLAATIVRVIRHRIGRRINDTESTGELGEQNSLLFDRLVNVWLPHWEKQAALEASGADTEAIGGLIIGGIDLAIDTPEPEEWGNL